MLKAELDWREIYDCKKGGTHVDSAQEGAKKAGYKYFCHNGRIFDSEFGVQVTCIKIESACSAAYRQEKDNAHT